jgi:hypothetical protein
MAGKNQHSHEVAADATILCGGKKCGLEDLKPGAVISVTTEKREDSTVATKIREGSTKHMAQKSGS